MPQTKLLNLSSPEANVKIISFHRVLQISVLVSFYINDWVALRIHPVGMLLEERNNPLLYLQAFFSIICTSSCHFMALTPIVKYFGWCLGENKEK
jgi:hypothetical protein